MASAVDHSPALSHSPHGPDSRRPKGILKNSSFQKSPPASPQRERSMSGKELTLANTQINAGRRRSSSSATRPPGSRRQSGQNLNSMDESAAAAQRLKWDEANLYLTEQERTSTMKIDEPKTPYAKHYDPLEDPSDDDDEIISTENGRWHGRRRPEEEIPGLDLGEPEAELPQPSSRSSSEKSVHVDSEALAPSVEEMSGPNLSPEEREKHRRFEEMRKRHYEMKNVAQLLGHPEAIPDDDDEEVEVPPVPPLPNGSA